MISGEHYKPIYTSSIGKNRNDIMLKKGITVIIPTYNRKELLEATLLSLTFQTLDFSLFEVIVIDDGSTDGTESVIAQFTSSINLKYFFQEDNGFRVAQARNIGIKNATHEICLFIDSGVVVEPKLLEYHLKAHRSTDNALAIVGYAYGFQEYTATDLNQNVSLNSRQSLNDAFLNLGEDQKDCRDNGLLDLGLKLEDLSIPWLLFWTCHASCTTNALKDIDGFDENFQSWGGEDVELAIRLYKNGVSFRSLKEAKAIHLPHERNSDSNRKSNMENAKYIYKKHPSWSVALLLQENTSWEHKIIQAHQTKAEYC